MGLPNTDIMSIQDLNSNYELSSTYPRAIMVPTGLTFEDIEKAAEFRSKNRMISVCWKNSEGKQVIARCSQPNIGVIGNRCAEDEKLVCLGLSSI